MKIVKDKKDLHLLKKIMLEIAKIDKVWLLQAWESPLQAQIICFAHEFVLPRVKNSFCSYDFLSVCSGHLQTEQCSNLLTSARFQTDSVSGVRSVCISLLAHWGKAEASAMTVVWLSVRSHGLSADQLWACSCISAMKAFI